MIQVIENAKAFRSVAAAVIVSASAVLIHCPAVGSVITNANDATVNIESPSAWTGGVAPGSSDTAVFLDVPSTDRFVMGTDLSLYGMEWRRPVPKAVTPGVGMKAATGSETLTLGAGGITFIPNPDNGGPRVYFDVPIVVSASQSWLGLPNSNGNLYPHFTCPVTVNEDLTIELRTDKQMFVAHEPFTVASGKNLKLRATSALIAQPVLLLVDNGRVLGNLDTTGGSVLLAPTNTATFHLSDYIASFVNNGVFYLGGTDEYKSGIGISVLFGEGDSLTATTAQSDRHYSSLRVFDSNVTVDGGDVRSRWFRLHNGRWTQKSGDVWFDYQNIIGCDSIATNSAVKEAIYDMQGGSYTFRRMAVGVANTDEYPARFLLSGGSVQSDLLNPDSTQTWYGGLDIAVRWMHHEARKDNSGLTYVGESAAGDVLVSGTATLAVPHIAIGANKALSPSETMMTNACARLRMTGGEIKMGNGGFKKAALWDDSSTSTSWYDFTFSGGKVTTLYTGASQDLNIRLSAADGGVTYDIGSGHTYTVNSPMFGSGGLVKTGEGTMVVNCGNDYTGRTEIASGSIVVRSGAAASGTAFTSSTAEVPMANMTIEADSLSGADGTAVSTWTANSGSSPQTSFAVSTAQAVMTSTMGVTPTAPVVTTNGFNGHKAVSFDGVSSALACGGADAGYVSSGDGTTQGFSVAMVVRFDGEGEGTSNYSWFSSRPFFGSTRSGHGPAYVWNFALTAAGQLHGGSVWAPKDNDNKEDWSDITTARPLPRWLDDGRPHVVVMTLPSKGEPGGKVTMTLDGYRSEMEAGWTKDTTLGYGKSYMTLGGSNMFKKNRYTACSIAEIRFWRGTQLTEAQIKAFSQQMSEKYGAELDGYTTFGVSGQHSKEIAVASGASYGTDDSSFTLPLYSGQTLSGAGDIVGKMSVQSNATVVLKSTGSPSFEDLTLEDGATIKIADTGAAAISADVLTVGASDVVTVDYSNVQTDKASVTLATYTSGTVTAANFVISPASSGYKMVVKDGKVKLLHPKGLNIVLR